MGIPCHTPTTPSPKHPLTCPPHHTSNMNLLKKERNPSLENRNPSVRMHAGM
jgi:hypothetical protein